MSRAERRAGRSTLDVAIIGIGLRFPGADEPRTLWRNLKEGVESTVEMSVGDCATGNTPYAREPHYVRAGAVLSNVEHFDAEFFGYSRREAELIDPQHRLFLECSWEAFEDAGYPPRSVKGSVGVYAGCSLNTYLINQLHPNRGYFPGRTFQESTYDLQLLLGSECDHLTTRVSHRLDLRGPSVNLQTACSTSLVAVHLGCQALCAGECDMVLAGSSNVRVPHAAGYLAEDGMMFSPDGHTRSFDAAARGTLFGSGVAAVLLKPLGAALRDRDSIYAVIKGSAVNNDGASKLSYSAPSVEGQAAVIRQALRRAGVTAESITYVEAHGTATPLGDIVEVAALRSAFATTQKQYCALGSIKTNFGHLVRTSGMAGLIKSALSLRHGQLPPTLHFCVPNPDLDLEQSPFYINTCLKEWVTEGVPRRAGVSAFGMGGTNAHVVLEEAPDLEGAKPAAREPWHVFSLSAKSDAALTDLVRHYVHGLRSGDLSGELGDVCHTANVGREQFQFRFAAAVSSYRELEARLQRLLESPSPVTPTKPASLAFLFPGQGSQYESMGWALYQTQPTFKQLIDECNDVLVSYAAFSLIEMLDPAGRPDMVHHAAVTQVVLFSLEYAIARLWMMWGVQPSFLMGHSLGQYAAAAIAGVFSFEEGLRLVMERGKLFDTLITSDGRMVSVNASEACVKQWIETYDSDVSIAAVNGEADTVVSGASPAISALCADLRQKGVRFKELNVSRACHSPLVDPVLAPLLAVAETIRFSPPKIPMICNRTGRQVGPEVATPGYWAQHARDTVRFADGMAELGRLGANVFLETGPDCVLLGMGARCLTEMDALWLPSLPRPSPGGRLDCWQRLTAGVAAIFQRGLMVNWQAFDADYQFNRVHLPTYRFQRERFWVDSSPPKLPEGLVRPEIDDTRPSAQSSDVEPTHPGRNEHLLELKWMEKPHDLSGTTREKAQTGWWLLISDGSASATSLAIRLRQLHGASVMTCSLKDLMNKAWTEALEPVVSGTPEAAYTVVYLSFGGSLQVTETHGQAEAIGLVWRACEGLTSFLLSVIERDRLPQKLCIVTRGAQHVVASDSVQGVLDAPLWPLGKVIGFEFPQISCLNVDLDPSDPTNEWLYNELSANSHERQVAYRGSCRYVARLAPPVRPLVPESASTATHDFRISRPEGAFLITGGLGGLGLIAAEWLASRGVRRMILMGRHAPSTEAQKVIAKLETTGVALTMVSGDVCVLADVRAAFEELDADGTPLSGIIHAAGVLDDCVLTELTRQRFLTVANPKIGGVLNLYAAVEERPQRPDYVILYSSASSLLGSAGQASYAAANGFLDAFASYWRHRGQACVSVNWGSWEGAGMLARNPVALRRSKQRGFLPLENGVALDTIPTILNSGYSQIGVVPMNWPQYLSEMSLAADPVYQLLVGKRADATVEKDGFRHALAQGDRGRRASILLQRVRDHAAHVLGMDSHPDSSVLIHDDTALTDYGLDSLSAIELKNRIQADVGCSLPITLALEYPSITAITSFVLECHAHTDPGLAESFSGAVRALETRQ